ncbi:hypothetical protein BD626DRAFT_627728 [Schizophyllum amplum]|uniref:FCP1 homology domain-containing protein n=1 Tax=Schizophyllum amplum TaxID=97359 RepID=A0A550CLP8_9AGAR|nr:hypothetical protein BD626DRAFT_627728 [Auriculariopsis ampla]
MDPYDYAPAYGVPAFASSSATFDPYEHIPPSSETHSDQQKFDRGEDRMSRRDGFHGRREYREQDHHRQQETYRQGSYGASRHWNYEETGRAPRPPYSWEHYERQDTMTAPLPFHPPFPLEHPPSRSSRLRSPSLPRQSSPSPDYMSLASRPSTLVHDPTCSRKLLILDLNGSLLVRAKYRTPTVVTGQPWTAPPTRLRKVHRRPYLQSFQDYVFHPATCTWLDTMVWSSAQPHSVHDMVDSCFGHAQKNFVAIWARDTLGLKDYEYHMKTQTTKDLTIPWQKLRLNPGDGKPHSASTTLLVDDSPLKARLQPYNHMAIQEYDNETRTRDQLAKVKAIARRLIKAGTAEQVEGDASTSSVGKRKRSPRDEGEDDGQSSASEDEHNDIDDAPVTSSDTSPLSKKERKERIRRERKRRKQERKRERSQGAYSGKTKDPQSLDVRTPSPEPTLEYTPLAGCDATLLAVVGVLDTIKHEDNVAGWMRHGALWAGRPAQKTPAGSADVAVAQPCTNSERVDPPEARGATMEPPNGSGDAPDEGTGRADATVAQGDAAGVPMRTLSPRDNAAGSSGQQRVVTRGDVSDVEGAGDASAPADNDSRPPAEVTGADAPAPNAPLWFENEEVMAHWVERGVKALAKLDIPLVHGVGGGGD